ncbi:MAG: hypothetical protein XXXJIFNMEKO3_02221 [Candidatus Erwinia impunctatus]
MEANKRVSFTADLNSARVSTLILEDAQTSKIADGVNTFTYTATVLDSNGNRVPAAALTATADKQHVSAVVNGITDAQGRVTVTLKSSTTATLDIMLSARVANTATANADRRVNFTADLASATVSSVVLNGSET